MMDKRLSIDPDSGQDLYPKISVIVPIYKVEKYLVQCVESIRNQTYTNLEIILVDDGSPDNCPEICDQFAAIDKRVKVIHKENGGLVSARKAGICQAEGEYVAYVDGDDWVEHDLYEKAFENGIKKCVDMIGFTSYVKEYQNGDKTVVGNCDLEGVFDQVSINQKIIPYFICTDTFFKTLIPSSLCMYVFKRNFLYNCQMAVDNRICMGEDTICIWLCLLKAKLLAICDCCEYHYRMRDDSIIHIYENDKFKEIKILYNELAHAFKDEVNYEQLRYQLNLYIFYLLLLSSYERLFLVEHRTYLFPYTKVKKGSKIVLYGAGPLGNEIYKTVTKYKYCELVLWVDRAYETYQRRGKNVDNPFKVQIVDYDYILIAVTRKSMVEQIEEVLLKLGVQKYKIAYIDEKVLVEKNLPLDLKELII